MDKETQALMDSLTEDQIKHLRKMLNAILPVFKVFAQAIIAELDDEQKAMLKAIVDKEGLSDVPG